MDGEIEEPTTPVITDIPITTPSLTKEEIIEIVKEEVKKEVERKLSEGKEAERTLNGVVNRRR